MKKKFGLLVVSLLALALFVKPSTVQAVEPTIVSGMIYEIDSQTPVHGADVTVDCNGNTEETTSLEDGAYAVEFVGGNECKPYCKVCEVGNTAYVTAIKDGASGSGSGVVHDYGLTVNVAIVNVAIPEFGLLTGALTLLSSIGTFFAIRKH